MSAAIPAGSQPPIAGRERELEWLAGQFRAAQAGQGSLALINGEAGIGKTALIEALAELAQSEGALILAGGGHDLTTPRPYALWIEVVERFTHSREHESRIPEPPPFLRATESSNPAGSQVELFAAAIDYFVALASVRPLLILLEDLHWTDRESLDLLRAIARGLVGHPALLVGTYRGEELARDAWLVRLLPHLVRESRARQLDLAALDRDAVQQLVVTRYDLDKQAREQLTAYLYERAEGNPLFTLELVRGLESARRIRTGPDGWGVHDLESLPLPSFLRHLIDERLARLPSEIHDRLSVAAIIGHESALDLWGNVCELSQTEIHETIELAIQAGLMAALPEGTSVRFAHALFREALYERTLPPRRAALHLRIAEELSRDAKPDPDTVAWHFQAASDRRAAEWLIRAAERAQQAYAWRAAADRLIAAEELLVEDVSGSELGWLRYRIGRLVRHSDTSVAIQRLRQAEQLGIWSRDPVLTAYARFDLGHTEVLGGDFERGLERMVSGDLMLDQLPDVDSRDAISAWVMDALPASTSGNTLPEAADNEVSINPRRGTLIQWLVEPGRYLEAWDLGTEYLEQIARLPAPGVQHISSEGDTWYALGRVHAAMGRPDDAALALTRAIECYERIDHHLLVGATRRVLLGEVVIPYRPDQLDLRRELARQAEESHAKAAGALSAQLSAGFASVEVLLLDGHWSQAREVLTPVAEHGAAIASVRLGAVSHLGWLAFHQGRSDEAWQRIRQVLPAGPETKPGDTSFVAAVALIQAAIGLALDQADDDLAAMWLATLERWLGWSGTTRWQAASLLARARIYAARGDAGQAQDHAEAAAVRASQPAQPLTHVAIRRLLGTLAASQDDFDTARSHSDSALRMARASDARYQIALTELSLAEIEASAGNRADALEFIQAARATLSQLEAEPALARAERLATQLADPADAANSSFGLSNREREVLRLVASGMTDAEVAETLSISYRTVTTHLTSIFNKLGVNSRVLATRFAVENDLV